MPRPSDPMSRYALYLAPPAAAPLWRFGSLVLGHDAETGRDVPGFELPSMHAARWHAATARARQYGFHATLKAPFRLARGRHEVELAEAVEDFAAGTAPLGDIALRLAVLDAGRDGGFLALVPLAHEPALHALEAAAVRALEPFRAPLTDAEVTRRNPAELSPRQRMHLAEYGYPHIFEDFQPHFTLSDRIEGAAQLRVEMEAQMRAAGIVPAITVDQLVLFRQTAPGERFRVFLRAPMQGCVVTPARGPALTGDLED